MQNENNQERRQEQDNRPPQPGTRNEGRNNRRQRQGQDRARQSRFEGR